MKKHFLLCISLSILAGCGSNESITGKSANDAATDSLSVSQADVAKAKKLVGDYFTELLVNPDSYEPVETSLSPAMNTAYNDSACCRVAMTMKYGYVQFSDRLQQFSNGSLEVLREFEDKLVDLASKLDNAKVVGWEIRHRFKCKGDDGIIYECDYRFVTDKELTRIVLEEDQDEESVSYLRDIIDKALSHYFRDLKLD